MAAKDTRRNAERIAAITNRSRAQTAQRRQQTDPLNTLVPRAVPYNPLRAQQMENEARARRELSMQSMGPIGPLAQPVMDLVGTDEGRGAIADTFEDAGDWLSGVGEAAGRHIAGGGIQRDLEAVPGAVAGLARAPFEYGAEQRRNAPDLDTILGATGNVFRAGAQTVADNPIAFLNAPERARVEAGRAALEYGPGVVGEMTNAPGGRVGDAAIRAQVLAAGGDEQAARDVMREAIPDVGWHVLNTLMLPGDVGAAASFARGLRSPIEGLQALRVADDAPFAFEGAAQVPHGSQLNLRTGQVEPASPIDFDAPIAPERSAMRDLGIGRGHPPNAPVSRESPLGNIAPEDRGVQIFAGQNARTADRAALARAQEMEASGASRDDIWRETGWFKGVDGQWRWEIDDSGSRMGDEALDFFFKGEGTGEPPTPYTNNARSVLEHGPLYEAYPDLGGRATRLQRRDFLPGGGDFDPRSGLIRAAAPDAGSARSVLLHEDQHAAQRQEGFAVGGNPDNVLGPELDAINRQLSRISDEMDHWRAYANNGPGGQFRAESEQNLARLRAEYNDLLMRRSREHSTEARQDAYRRLAGETEARNVQERQDLTPIERRARPPWETQDVPDDQQIIRFDADRMEARPAPASPLEGVGEPPARSNRNRWQAAVRDPETGEVYLGDNHADAIGNAPEARQDALYETAHKGSPDYGFEQRRMLAERIREQIDMAPPPGNRPPPPGSEGVGARSPLSDLGNTGGSLPPRTSGPPQGPIFSGLDQDYIARLEQRIYNLRNQTTPRARTELRDLEDQLARIRAGETPIGTGRLATEPMRAQRDWERLSPELSPEQRQQVLERSSREGGGSSGLPPNGSGPPTPPETPRRGSGGSVDPLTALMIGGAGAVTLAAGGAEAAQGQELESARAEVDGLEGELATLNALDENDEESVRAVQRILVSRGFDVGGPDPGHPDGRYGGATFQAIRQVRPMIETALAAARDRRDEVERAERIRRYQGQTDPLSQALPIAAVGAGYLLGHGSRLGEALLEGRAVRRVNEDLNRRIPRDPLPRGTTRREREQRMDHVTAVNELYRRGGAAETPFQESGNLVFRRRPGGGTDPTELYPDPGPIETYVRPSDPVTAVIGGVTATYSYTQYEEAKQERIAAEQAAVAADYSEESLDRLSRARAAEERWDMLWRLEAGFTGGRLGGLVHEWPTVRPDMQALERARLMGNDYLAEQSAARAAARRRRPPNDR